ncbi:MAG: 16S rRNA (cytidine(1402)-2'-O)-methyltransferase [Candidatus Brocadiia bacterium]
MGELWVGSTPIGNLSDASPRLREAIEKADLIACEDTRVCASLCAALGLRYRRMVSYYEQNERQRCDELAGELAAGKTILLLSSAGTPLISDPGYHIVKRAVEEGVRVSPIPGPCAAIAALSCSGLRVDKFAFLGFPPRKPGKLRSFLTSHAGFDGTLIMYESANRVARLATAAYEVFGPVQGVLGREITKLHEEFIRGNLRMLAAELEARPNLKGECCLMIELREDNAGVGLEAES